MAGKILPRKIGNLIRIESELEWKYTYFEKEGKWLGLCPSLHIALQCDTLEELQQDMLEAADALFQAVTKDGKLKSFLRAHGWATKDPLPVKSRRSTVDMPIRFRRVEANDLQEAVC